MAIETDPVVMATSEILLSSNGHVNIVVFCSSGHLCAYVLITFFFVCGVGGSFKNCFTLTGQVSWFVFAIQQ